MAPHVVEETCKIGRPRRQDAQQGIVSDRRHYGVSVVLLDHRHAGRAAGSAFTYLVRGGNYSRNTRCQTFSVYLQFSLAVYQKAVTAEHDYGFDAWSLADGDSKVANGRHQLSVKGFGSLFIVGNLHSYSLELPRFTGYYRQPGTRRRPTSFKAGYDPS
jgi:hypothetical protein